MKKDISFEEALVKLEEKVKLLEGGNMTLDESLSAFEESIALCKLCNEKLELAERRVRILVEGDDGSVTDARFEEENEA